MTAVLQGSDALEAVPRGRSRTHFAGLDLFRFLLLLLGMFTHAFVIGVAFVPEPRFLYLPSQTTFMFRMEAFFLIAGYLSATASGTRSAWLNKRVQRLGIPFVFTVLIINNLTVWLSPVVYPATLGLYTLHVWFLAALLAHSIVLWACGDRIDRIIPALERRLTTANVVPILLVLLLVYEFAVKTLYKLTARGPERSATVHLIDNMMTYLPFFIGGYLLCKSPGLLRMLRTHVRTLTGIALVAAVAVIFVFHSGDPDGTLATVARIALKTCLGFSLSLLILFAALAIKRVPPLVAFLSQGSYAVYVMHVLIVNILYRLFFTVSDHGIYTFAVFVSLLTPLVGYVIYGLVIRHYKVLRLLFTGAAAGSRPSAAHKPAPPPRRPLDLGETRSG